MGKFWGAVVVWWQGKKTMVGGALVMAAAAAGVWYGKLDPVSGLTLLGIGLSIAGFSAKENRHQAELLTALQGVAQIGADERAGKSAQVILQDAEGTVLPLAAPAALGYAIGSTPVQQAAASLHLSADSVQELAVAVQHLAGNVDPLLPPYQVAPVGGPAK